MMYDHYGFESSSYQVMDEEDRAEGLESPSPRVPNHRDLFEGSFSWAKIPRLIEANTYVQGRNQRMIQVRLVDRCKRLLHFSRTIGCEPASKHTDTSRGRDSIRSGLCLQLLQHWRDFVAFGIFSIYKLLLSSESRVVQNLLVALE